MEEKLIGLLVRGLAVIARHGHVDPLRDQAAAQQFQALDDVLGNNDRIGPLALGDGEGHGRGPRPGAFMTVTGQHPGPRVGRFRTDLDIGDIPDIDGPAITRGQQEKPDIGLALKGLAGNDSPGLVDRGDTPGREGAVGLGNASGQLLQGHAIKRKALRIRLDADLVRPAAGEIGQPDILDRHQGGPQFLGDIVERIVIPAVRQFGARRQGQGNDRHIIDAPADDQGLRNTQRHPIHIGAKTFMHAQDRIIGIRADLEPRGDHDLVILGLGIDVFNGIDGADDGFQRFRDQLDRIGGAQAIGPHHDVHHRHGDLRLFLTRNHHQGQETHGQGGHQDEGRQGRSDEGAGEISGQTELHGCTRTSPADRPDRISTPCGVSRPRWTTISVT